MQKNEKIVIKNLLFKFNKKENFFFKQPYLELQAGAIYFLQGKNGSGKSTFFRILQGNIHQDEQIIGSFSINNVEHDTKKNKVPPEFTQQVRAVQQDIDSMIIGEFTVKQNLQMACIGSYPGIKKLPDVIKTSDFIHDFALDLTKKAELLSGGQRQILAILMMLQKPASLLLLDEPTAALDPKNSHMVIQCLQQLVQTIGITIIVITHDLDIVNTYAKNNIIYLQENQDGLREFLPQ